MTIIYLDFKPSLVNKTGFHVTRRTPETNKRKKPKG